MDAFADHGEVAGDQVTGKAGEAQAVFDQLAAVGIDFDDVLVVLETEGVDKFKKSWLELSRPSRARWRRPASDGRRPSTRPRRRRGRG